MPSSIMTTARVLADELIEAGAQAVILVGSQARGDAHAHSDIDLLALGDGPGYRLVRRDGHLIALTWQTAAACRESFTQPFAVGSVVPGWRGAVLLRDPAGQAAVIQAEAQRWTWDMVAGSVDALVAEEVTGYGEEVHKLVGALAGGKSLLAAVQRDVLALRLGPIMALHHRLLYDTENRLWELVAARMGARWSAAMKRAFGLGSERFDETCAAALELYSLAAAEVWPLFDERQRAVVEHACCLAGHPLPPEAGPAA